MTIDGFKQSSEEERTPIEAAKGNLKQILELNLTDSFLSGD